MKFNIYSSKVSTLIQLNRYGNIVDETINIWKKIDYNHYIQCIKKAKELEKYSETLKDKYEKYNEQKDIKKNIEKKVHNKEDIEKMKKEMNKMIDEDKSLNNIEKKEFKKIVESNIRCEYGTKNEDKVVQKNKIKDNNLSCHFLYHTFKYNSKNHSICFIGKIDGKTEDNMLVEIKNRVRGFMYKIPKYELCQVHIYMKMMNVKECKLIEQYNDEQKITYITFDKTFWDDMMNTLEIYFKHLIDFLSNQQVCIDFLCKDDNLKKRYIINNFYKPYIEDNDMKTLLHFGFISSK